MNYGKDFTLQPEQDRPMGGIKTAALALCFTLARRGHDVHLFAQGTSPGQYNGVTFHERGEFARFAETEHDVDVLVAIPEILPLLMPLRARARVVWSGNAYLTGDCALSVPWTWTQDTGRRGNRTRLYSMALFHPYVDRIIVGSRWQARRARDSCPDIGNRLTVIYLGVPLEYYRDPAPVRHRHRLVYTSPSGRGLRLLLDLFPAVRADVPEAELHVFVSKDEVARTLPDLKGASQPGVYWRGYVSKSSLARELRSAGLLTYASRSETFCLAVAEAQAAGLPVVASDRAALPERVSHGIDGFLIPGKPGAPAYKDAFVEAVIRLLRDDDLWAQMGAKARKKAWRLYDWEAIASTWEEELEQLVAGREPAAPFVDPTLNLLDPSLLTVSESGTSAEVPPEFAKRWLQEAWTSYGYPPNNVPSLSDA